MDQTIAQCGDDSLRDDEPMLQDLRTHGREDQAGPQLRRDQDAVIVRYTGSPAKITVTRAQFEELTADLLDETIRITKRTLAEAEAKYPGIRRQISDVLLVGGSSRMPAVSAALRKEFGWNPEAGRSGPGRGQGGGPVRGRADRALRRRRGPAARAAGWPVRRHRGRRTAQLPPERGPVTDEAVRAVADQTGLAEDQRPQTRPADRRQRAAEGDRGQARGHRRSRAGRTTSSRPSTCGTWLTRRRSFPFRREPLRRPAPWPTTSPRSRSRSGNRPGPARAGRWPPTTGLKARSTAAGSRTWSFMHCPTGSPINMEIKRGRRKGPSTSER